MLYTPVVRLVPTATICLLLSLAAKWAADAFLRVRVPIVGTFLGLQPSQNPGIAFGIRLPPAMQTGLIAVAILLVCWMALTARRSTLASLAYGGIIGGALANVLDRLRDGTVTDFFQVGSFPIFNVADSCISVGVALLLCDALLRRRAPSGVAAASPIVKSGCRC